MNERIESALRTAKGLNRNIKAFMDEFSSVEDNVDRDGLTVDERSHFYALYQAVDKLEDAAYLLRQMGKTVIADGYLYKNDNGRYEIDGMELTSGSPIEYYDEERQYFIPSSIEHHMDYYIVDLGTDQPIGGIRARIKRSR